MARRFRTATRQPAYSAKNAQVLAIATRGGRNLHLASMVDGKATVAACGEPTKGHYAAEHAAIIMEEAGATDLDGCVTCQHCRSMSAAEAKRRMAAWRNSGC